MASVVRQRLTAMLFNLVMASFAALAGYAYFSGMFEPNVLVLVMPAAAVMAMLLLRDAD